MRDDISKFVVAGDWHMHKDFARKMIGETAKRGIDTIVHLGDYGYTFNHHFVKWVEEKCAKEGVTIYFIDGNHDDFDYLARIPRTDDGLGVVSSHVYHLPRGYRWMWCGQEMVALGGAYSIDEFMRMQGTEWWPDELITYGQARKVIEGGIARFMFTHDCPSGVDIKKTMLLSHSIEMKAEGNRKILRQVVDVVKPEYLFHGHFHQRYDDRLVGLDYQTEIVGLDRDGTPFEKNCFVVDLEEI